LKWPFKEKEVGRIVDAIERDKSLLELALTNDSRMLIQSIKKHARENDKQLALLIETIRDFSLDNEEQIFQLKDDLLHITYLQTKISHGQDEQERNAILDWLSPVDYAPQQSDFISRRQPKTGQWFLDSPEYNNWLQTTNSVLYCHGMPGAGKTMISAIVIDDLIARYKGISGVATAYLYCNFNRRHEQQATDLMLSLLKQLTQASPVIPHSVKAMHQKHTAEKSRPLIDEISRSIQSVISTYFRVFIVIDGLDELQITDGCRSRFLTEVVKIQASSAANMFTTSRSIPDIMKNFEGGPSLEIRATEEDVLRYLDGQMYQLPGFVGRNPELQEEIKAKIVHRVQGMWVFTCLVFCISGDLTFS
jgi:hypothetical protein